MDTPIAAAATVEEQLDDNDGDDDELHVVEEGELVGVLGLGTQDEHVPDLCTSLPRQFL